MAKVAREPRGNPFFFKGIEDLVQMEKYLVQMEKYLGQREEDLNKREEDLNQREEDLERRRRKIEQKESEHSWEEECFDSGWLASIKEWYEENHSFR